MTYKKMSGVRRTCPVFRGRVRPVRFPLGTGRTLSGRTDRQENGGRNGG